MSQKILGVDSSSSKTGLCLLVDGKPRKIELIRSNAKLSLEERLVEIQDQVRSFFPVDLVVIEKVSVRRNLNTVRMLAYFEAAVMIEAAKQGTPVLQLAPMSARKDAFGHSLSKELVYNKLAKKYKLLEFDKGGNDQSDAITLALAGHKKYGKSGDIKRRAESAKRKSKSVSKTRQVRRKKPGPRKKKEGTRTRTRSRKSTRQPR